VNNTTSSNSTPVLDAQTLLAALQATATSTLERKRRLGHYAVVWQDGRPVAIGEDRPDTEPALEHPPAQSPR
jgi:hypothetical protein